MDLIQPLFAVGLVLGLLWGIVHFLKGRNLAMPAVLSRAARRDADLEVLGRISLTPQHSVFRIRDGERRLLVGLHPRGLVLLNDTEAAYGQNTSARLPGNEVV
ncbi:MAG TPA: hypothetical protein VHD76_10270 [Bryobacteraceae bacterium]|jgi:flagellar biogenesis protein FliO|nr:hypothetical protein [Bryobacteraceae bacterium]